MYCKFRCTKNCIYFNLCIKKQPCNCIIVASHLDSALYVSRQGSNASWGSQPPGSAPQEHLVSQQSKKPFFGVQKSVEEQLANKKFARLSRRFVSPGLSNRLSHP